MNTFLIDGTNFNISNTLYDTLCSDCYYFGYIKNEKPNISGFLNHLIHHLSQYREDLHSNFLKTNNNNEELALNIEQNIYNVYLKTFDISDDSKVNIQLRINKQHLDTFIQIFDNHLNKYNMDFTNYIRTLLIDYAARPIYQREYFSIYNYSKIILQAQKQSKFINIRTENETIQMVPVGLEKFYLNEQFYLCGFTKNKEEIVIIKYSQIKSVTPLENKLIINEKDYEAIIETINNYFYKLEHMEN